MQAITAVLECQPKIARCSDFYVNSPNFKHLQVIKKKKLSVYPCHCQKTEKIIAHVHRLVAAYGYQPGIYTLVITSLWCKSSYSPNLKQTIVINFRY